MSSLMPRPALGARSVTNGKGAEEDLVERKGPAHEEVWTKLVGRTNEERIFINGHPVTALLDTGSQVTHDSHDFCLAKGIKIHPITQLINNEGTGGTTLSMWVILKLNYPSLWGHKPLTLKLYCWFCTPLSIRKGSLWQYAPLLLVWQWTSLIRIIQNMCQNHGKLVCCATQSKNWSRHSPVRKGPSRLPSQSHCHPSLQQL